MYHEIETMEIGQLYQIENGPPPDFIGLLKRKRRYHVLGTLFPNIP
jgi:hypothetical protein